MSSAASIYQHQLPWLLLVNFTILCQVLQMHGTMYCSPGARASTRTVATADKDAEEMWKDTKEMQGMT